jgi:glucosamine--fructose-6-phosphate aminotransferase (isomerizing)
MTSAMRSTMAGQPAELRRILADTAPAEAAAARIADARRILLVGTGTSWHGANHGAYLLCAAGREAWAIQAFDTATGGAQPTEGDAVILISHRNTKRYGALVRDRVRAAGIASVLVTGLGAGGDLETTASETSAAFTASHLGAIARIAQLAVALGAPLGDLDAVPAAVEAALAGAGPGVTAPKRLLELTGAGTNAWTAAEGALKVRETCYVATEGLSAEQLFHGPAVALMPGDALVALDGGGAGADRVAEVADAAERFGVTTYRVVERDLSEPLSVFPLTVAVQRIALELAEALGTNPDSFGRDRPGHEEAWGRLTL